MREYTKGRHGPKPVTGPFDTREQLESAVLEMLESGQSQREIATTFGLPPATVNNVCKVLKGRENERRATLKRAVLRGDWSKLGEVYERIGVGDCDVGAGDGPGEDGDAGGDAHVHHTGYGRSRRDKNPFECEIPAPAFKGKVSG